MHGGTIMILCIVGPTGVGKTKMSIELAKKLNAIIVNADAVQIYKYLNIGSAKIKNDEKEGIEHLMFDIKEPNEEYSIKDYQSDLRNILEKYKSRNIILVGGTGLYICAGLMDYRFYDDINNESYDELSNDELYELVLKKDKNSRIDKHNRVRMLRFLKRPNKELIEPKLLYNDVHFIGLTTNRDRLYDVINNRVDKMIQEGLVEEVANLYHKYPNSRILKRAIGYKEIISYLNNSITLDEAILLIKKNSRHYAKRQYTWFNNKMNIKWFVVDYNNFDNTISQVTKYLGL